MTDIDLIYTPKKAEKVRNKGQKPSPKTTPLPRKRVPSEAKKRDTFKEGRVGERPVAQTIDQSTERFILEKTAFYLPEDLSDKIDEAVAYFRRKHKIKKVDRSTFLSALLDNPENWTKPSLDKLIDRIIKYLTSRATGRPVD